MKIISTCKIIRPLCEMTEYGYALVTIFIPIFLFMARHLRRTSVQMLSTTDSIKKKKVVVITGCDSGIGLELGKHVLKWGYHLIACCLDENSYGARILRSSEAEIAQLDVCQHLFVKDLLNRVTKLEEEGKDIWCLVNNAGIMTYAKAEWLKWDMIESQILVNLGGTIQLSNALLPSIRICKGRIINISSPQGMIASPYMSVYCASKFGVEAFTQSLRRETANLGVKVVVLRPCNIPHKTSILKKNSEQLLKMKTEMNDGALSLYDHEIDAIINQFQENFDEEEKDRDPTDIQDSYLIHAFRHALESPSPSRSYTAAPVKVRIFLALFTLLPEALLDILISWNFHTKVINWGKMP